MEKIIHLFIPILCFFGVSFAFGLKAKGVAVRYFLVSLMVGFLLVVFGPTCLCNDLDEKLYGAALFSVAITAVVFAMVFLGELAVNKVKGKKDKL